MTKRLSSSNVGVGLPLDGMVNSPELGVVVMSGNFLSCSKGVKDPLEVPEVRCD